MSTEEEDTARVFLKMHGLGNDFVILDARTAPLRVTPAVARRLADRRTGVGCDQVILLRPSEAADVFMAIHNADGGEVAACGNASRCVGRVLMEETGRDAVTIETRAGVLVVRRGEPGGWQVDMGPPGLDWTEMPLARPADMMSLPVAADSLAHPVGVSMGNPHAVFFVGDLDAVDLAALGPRLEHDPLFPERANITAALVLDSEHIAVRVWERGVGLTQACGTAACATLVAGHLRGLTGRQAAIGLPGGTLLIDWRDSDDHVLMTGPAELAFRGEIPLPALEVVEESA